MMRHKLKLNKEEIELKELSYGKHLEAEVLGESTGKMNYMEFMRQVMYRMVCDKLYDQNGYREALKLAKEKVNSLSVADGRLLKNKCKELLALGGDAEKKS